jgi:hypothetical protein
MTGIDGEIDLPACGRTGHRPDGRLDLFHLRAARPGCNPNYPERLLSWANKQIKTVRYLGLCTNLDEQIAQPLRDDWLQENVISNTLDHKGSDARCRIVEVSAYDLLYVLRKNQSGSYSSSGFDSNYLVLSETH